MYRKNSPCLFDLYLFGGVPFQSSWLISRAARHFRSPLAPECLYHWGVDWQSVLAWAQDCLLCGQRAWTAVSGIRRCTVYELC